MSLFFPPQMKRSTHLYHQTHTVTHTHTRYPAVCSWAGCCGALLTAALLNGHEVRFLGWTTGGDVAAKQRVTSRLHFQTF